MTTISTNRTNIMKKMIIFISLIFTLQTMAKEKIYKYVDAQGIIHYTKNKPENKASSEVKIYKAKKKTTTEQDDAKDDAKGDKKDDSKLTEEQKKVKAYNEKERARVKAEQDRQNCIIARKNLETLNKSTRVRKTNPVTGEEIIIENSELDDMIEQTKQKIQDLCH